MLRNSQLAKWKENIKKCNSYKDKLAKAVRLIKLEFNANRISKLEYEKKIFKLLEGKTLDYWNDYYNNLISTYNSKLSSSKKKYSYALLTTIFLIMSVFALINLGDLTGQVVYGGATGHGYIDRGGSCSYSPVGLLTDTQIDDSIYFSQGPHNGAYTVYDWVSGQDMVYQDLGPISESRSLVTQVSITWNGRFSKTTGSGKPPSEMAISYYDWNTGTWTPFDQGQLSQAEKTSTITITDIGIIPSIISAETGGLVRIGFQAIGTTELCNGLVLTDYTSLEVLASPPTTTTTTTSTSTSTSTSTVTTSTTTTITSTTTSTSTSTTSSSTTSTSTTSTSTILTSLEGLVLVEVEASLGIVVDAVYSTSDFGLLIIDSFDDTLDNVPLPILIRNEGSILADVQISATELWTSPNRVSSDYRFSIDVPDPAALTLTETGLPADSCSPIQCFDALGTQLLPLDIPITPALPANAVDDLDFADGNDEAEINIYIHVPNDEPAGSKASTLTITGVDGSTF